MANNVINWERAEFRAVQAVANDPETAEKAITQAQKDGWAYLILRADNTLVVSTVAEFARGMRSTAAKYGAVVATVYVSAGCRAAYEATQGRHFRKNWTVYV